MKTQIKIYDRNTASPIHWIHINPLRVHYAVIILSVNIKLTKSKIIYALNDLVVHPQTFFFFKVALMVNKFLHYLFFPNESKTMVQINEATIFCIHFKF